MRFLMSQVQKLGFRSWVVAYLAAALTVLAVQYDIFAQVMLWASGVLLFVGVFLEIDPQSVPGYDMHVACDLFLGLGMVVLFYSYGLYAHTALSAALTIFDCSRIRAD